MSKKSSSVNEEQLARVVADISVGAEDPKHVASLVGAFMQRQPTIGHYVSSHSRELGLEGVVLTLLHASVVARCLEISAGCTLRAASAADLDVAARIYSAEMLASDEPVLAGYLQGNIPVDDATLGGKRRVTALDLIGTVAYALRDQPARGS